MQRSKLHRFKYQGSAKPLVMAAITLGLCSPLGANAETATDLGTVGTQGGGGGVSAVAPAKASLSATQPQAVIDRTFIEDAKSPVSDFATLAAITPGVSGGISANGPGLTDGNKVTLRGFKDGEYNVTFDDIPFGDTNGPTHHPTAFFPASIIDHITVERGPGNASNLGQATFGGSVNLYSLVPSSEFSFSPFISTGSWNTKLTGFRIDSGTIAELGGSKLLVNTQEITSDGYLTNSALWNGNVTAKYEQPIGSSTLLTLFSSNQKNYYYQSDVLKGLTLAQAAIYGKNFAMSSDPTSAFYYGYNRTDKTTTFDYIRLQSDLGCGLTVDNTSYYIWYGNHTLSSAASNPATGLGSVYNTPGGPKSAATQMPGYIKINQYTIYGDVLKVTKQTDAGLLRVGVWGEWTNTQRSIYDYNLFGMTPDYELTAIGGTAKNVSNVLYDQGSRWNNYQPFAEFEWAVTKDLTVTPGIKLMRWEQFIDAAVLDKNARIPASIHNDYTATLPYLTANYKIDKNSSVYAQYAQGMLVPDISTYYSPSYQSTVVTPQTSTNYQIGYVQKSDNIAFDVDVYYIDFANKLTLDTSFTDPVYYNAGGVVYKGIEGQLTFGVGNGFSIYTNGSISSSLSKATSLSIANVPGSTGALGLLYNAHGWASSLVYKYVGKEFADASEVIAIDPYATLDCSIGYTFKNPGFGAKKMKFDLGVYNLLNRQDVIAATTANLYTWQPERSVMASLRLEF